MQCHSVTAMVGDAVPSRTSETRIPILHWIAIRGGFRGVQKFSGSTPGYRIKCESILTRVCLLNSDMTLFQHVPPLIFVSRNTESNSAPQLFFNKRIFNLNCLLHLLMSHRFLFIILFYFLKGCSRGGAHVNNHLRMRVYIHSWQ